MMWEIKGGYVQLLTLPKCTLVNNCHKMKRNNCNKNNFVKKHKDNHHKN